MGLSITIRSPKLQPGLRVQIIVLFQDTSLAPEQELYDTVQNEEAQPTLKEWLESAARIGNINNGLFY